MDAKLLGSLQHERKYKTVLSLIKREHYSLFIDSPALSFGFAEACRLMGTRVRREMDRKKAHVLLVTSVTENEGKSTVASNLAMALAQEGRNVLLVDCDFRKPAQYKILNLSQEIQEDHDLGIALQKGLPIQPVLVGVEKNLPVLISVAPHRSLLRQKGTNSLGYLLYQLRKDADYIILDTPPLGLVAEGERIVAFADASLLVVRQDAVEARFINDAIDRLNETNAKVIGCIFNNVHTGFFSRVGSYGSYYGYGGYHYGRYGRYGHYGAYGPYGHYAHGKTEDEETGVEKTGSDVLGQGGAK
ncbi:MAG: CpsD/CapB family tyrosine-protein kinase [Lachnospiraceae bacterium]|nr:CpsD/CapB family tyrosine-protein kinase [Lachnospiraceae bacterium]